MVMEILRTKVVVALFASTTLILPVSCTKDKEDPTITVTSPPEAALLHWGDIVLAEATFSDDKKLLSYHIHTGDSLGDHIPEWDWETEADIHKGIYVWDEHITVPDSVPDSVWLHFEVTDEVGKTAESAVLLQISE